MSIFEQPGAPPGYLGLFKPHMLEPLDPPLRPCMNGVIYGLKAQSELNGKPCEIVEFDEENVRWKVQLEDGTGKLIRRESIRIPDSCGAIWKLTRPSFPALRPGARIRASGLASKPEVNGQLGTVIDWDEKEQRWMVNMDDGARRSLKPGNVTVFEKRLGPGASVTVSNMENVELNGMKATLMKWDRQRACWQVRFKDGVLRCIEGRHITACAPSSSEDSMVSSDGCSKRYAPPVRPVHRTAAALVLAATTAAAAAAETYRDPPPYAVAAPTGPDACPQIAATAATTAHHDSEGRSLAPGMEVCLTGLQSRPELNGQKGVLVAFDEQESRWKVSMHANGCDPYGMMAKSANLSLPSDRVPITKGQKVRAVGLTNKPDLNGQTGVAVQWDQVACRWQVLMDDNAGRLLDISKLEAIPSDVDCILSEPSEMLSGPSCT